MFKENKGIFGQYREVLDKAKQERGKTLKGQGIFNVDDLEKIFSPDEIKNVLKLEVGENERGEQERYRAFFDSEEASVSWSKELKEAVSRKLSEDLSETEKKTSWREGLQNLVARKYIKELLEQEKPKKAINGLKNKFDLSDEQIQEVGEEELREKITSYKISNLLEKNFGKKPEVEVLPLPKEKIEEVFFQETERALSEGDFYLANNIKYPFSKESEERTDFISPKNIFQRPEIQEAFFLGLSEQLSRSNFKQDDINVARENFFIPEEKFSRAIEREIVNRLSQERIDEAINIKKAFPEFLNKLNSPEIEKIAIQAFINHLSRGRIEYILKIKDDFNILSEKINPSELEEAALKGLVICLSDGDIDNALKIKENFRVPLEKFNKKDIGNWAALIYPEETKDVLKKTKLENYLIEYNNIVKAIDCLKELTPDQLEDLLKREISAKSSVILTSMFTRVSYQELELGKRKYSDTFCERTEKEYEYLKQLFPKIDPQTPMTKVLSESPFKAFYWVWPDGKDSQDAEPENKNMSIKDYIEMLEKTREHRNVKKHHDILCKQVFVSRVLGFDEIIIYASNKPSSLYHEKIHRTLAMHPDLLRKYHDYADEKGFFKSEDNLRNQRLMLAPGYNYEEEFIVETLTQIKYPDFNEGTSSFEYPPQLISELNQSMQDDSRKIYQESRVALRRLYRRKESMDRHLWSKLIEAEK